MKTVFVTVDSENSPLGYLVSKWDNRSLAQLTEGLLIHLLLKEKNRVDATSIRVESDDDKVYRVVIDSQTDYTDSKLQVTAKAFVDGYQEATRILTGKPYFQVVKMQHPSN